VLQCSLSYVSSRNVSIAVDEQSNLLHASDFIAVLWKKVSRKA
jgi:hypothetical protein